MDQEKISELMKKAQEMAKSGHVDLSTEEDLSIAVMNLISLEEHFFFTGSKTEKPEYFEMLTEIREMRKKLLGKMINAHEGETWCITKHLLSATMRCIEVGTKLHADGKKEEAQEFFLNAQKLYSMFWALRLKLINVDGVKKIADKERSWDIKDIVSKLVNCCDE